MQGLPTLKTSVVDAIGATPLVSLERVARGVDGRILAKLEMLNPGFSKKDRAARQIIDEAESNGDLSPGQTVVELTSGNMGTGLAIVCASRGYPFVAVMSKGNSSERARMMRALGAKVVLVDQEPGSRVGQVSGNDLQRVEEKTRALVEELGAFRADQFLRAGSWRAHYAGTAPELWQQSGGEINAFCDFVGSGGTLAGCARFFEAKAPSVRCYAVEPEGAAVLSGETASHTDHPIQGGGYAMSNLALLEGVNLDGFIKVSAQEATECARRLAREEGIFGGYSSGANLAAALKLLTGPERGSTVAILVCDSGLKYLSTDLWP